MKTFLAKNTDVEKKWHLVDADGAVLGRLASRVASILKGKTKPIYTPYIDTGDFVVVINAGKVRLTGNKLENKEYFRHSGYPGGIKKRTAKELMNSTPEKLIISAVHGMLPKNRLGRKQMKKLKVYSGPEHPHQSQNPVALKLNKA
ncbi:MAG TPA: 50S ribosomal protein L13 [Nitrospirae bacterium]|nr:50S ribosomal protein L13 [bacterium BMS3Abin10]GBE38063.1 50S ribosomal protein L13 [bacterium BMS3Bbin08]HDH51469.1 50S ribosomal protein L13 [Nitrospirota bacterium]HDZ84689.1 50S ribosomal protein L13 [Nitrospirota bacterium]